MLATTETVNNIQRIGDESAYGVFTFDLLTLKLTYVNDKFASIFEVSKEQLLNKPRLLVTLLLTEEIKYLQQQHVQLLTSGSVDTELCFCQPGKAAKHFRCNAFANAHEATGFIKDISAQKEEEATYMLEVARAAFLSGTDEQERLSPAGNPAIKSRFNILRLLEMLRDALKQHYPGNHFRVITHLPALHTSIDCISFFQLLQHMVANTVRLSKENSEIDIVVEACETDQFMVNIRCMQTKIPEAWEAHLHPDADSSFFNNIPELADLYAARTLAEHMGIHLRLVYEKGKAYSAAGFFFKE